MTRDPARHVAVRIFAQPLVVARDAVARGLIRVRVSPNLLTVFGTVFTLGAGYFLATGAEQRWSDGGIPAGFWAGWMLIGACAMDMLDGAVAKLGRMATPFGGILDSTMDRLSDMAIFGGMSLAYGRLGEEAFAVLAIVGLSNAILISYIKARAETEVSDCSTGFWQRGERMVAILAGCFAGHVGTVVVVMAVFPALTVLGRLLECRRQLGGGRSGVRFWPCRRGTWRHTIVAMTFFGVMVLVDIRPDDVLRHFSGSP